MIKKTLSVILAVMMVVSMLTISVVTTNAATTDDFSPSASKFYFDVEGAVDANGTPWSEIMTSKDKIAFYLAGGDFDTDANATQPKAWGAKALQGTATSGQSGIWEFEPGKKNYTFTEGVQYKIIFVRTEGANWKDQTCALFFTTDCLGHVAHCDGTMMENDVDSTKKSLTVYWDDSIDPAENGPALCITSIGNVVGSCVEQGKTKESLFTEFISEPKDDFNGKTGLENARYYTVEQAKTKTEQEMIDDIATELGLSKEQVAEAFSTTSVETVWDVTASNIPDPASPTEAPATEAPATEAPATEAPHVHTPGEPTEENVVPATCQHAGSYDKVVYCTTCGEEISREEIVIGKLLHTPGEPVIENDTPSTCSVQGSYDEVVYCTECKEEISRETKYHDLAPHTPGEPVIENAVPAQCEVAGSHDSIVKCTDCGQKIEALCEYDVVDDPTGHDDPLEYVPEVPATASVNGVAAHYKCNSCGKLFSDATGTNEVQAEDLVIEAEHKRGDADGNGEFEMIDVTTVQRYLVGLSVPANWDAIAADADLDEEIDIIDVSLMQRVLANMTTFEAWDAKHAKG